MSVRLAAREALQCRPGTAGTGRRRRSEGTAWGRCPPPAAGGSVVPRREATAEPPRGPCSPSAEVRTLGLALGDTKKHKHMPALCYKGDTLLILLSNWRYAHTPKQTKDRLVRESCLEMCCMQVSRQQHAAPLGLVTGNSPFPSKNIFSEER